MHNIHQYRKMLMRIGNEIIVSKLSAYNTKPNCFHQLSKSVLKECKQPVYIPKANAINDKITEFMALNDYPPPVVED